MRELTPEEIDAVGRGPFAMLTSPPSAYSAAIFIAADGTSRAAAPLDFQSTDRRFSQHN